MPSKAAGRPLLLARLLLAAAGLMLAGSLASLLMPGTELIPDRPSLIDFLAVGSIIGVFAVVGVTILRYRLYDIDLVIRRTLVYAVVVAVLGSVYVGLVLALQAALSGMLGGGTISVAVSILATAALFGPVRQRVQMSIDRRFYRSRYDAERTVEAFTRRLRTKWSSRPLRRRSSTWPARPSGHAGRHSGSADTGELGEG